MAEHHGFRVIVQDGAHTTTDTFDVMDAARECARMLAGRGQKVRCCEVIRKPAPVWHVTPFEEELRDIEWRERWYIAGPMSGLPALNFPAFHAEAARLRKLGFDVVNPAEINADPKAGWETCMRADIAQLVTCVGLALLPGWEGSRGAKLEHHIATALGMRIRMASQITGCAVVLEGS
jgi:hypothetical protein